ncbi:MAG: ABC transporter permease [Actinomycetota bacterium]|nr:ABC transporter permease [Actinomycetota bacterium]
MGGFSHGVRGSGLYCPPIGSDLNETLLFLLLGLGAGGVYAALGLGLVVVHRVSGVVNVAHGAMASAATYVFVDLRADMPFATALLLALLVAAVLGLVVHWLVFRPLRQAPTLARVVASVGLMVALQAAIVLRFGSANRSVAAVLPSQPVSLFGVDVPRDRLLLAGLAVAAAAALWALGRFTRTGLASRAVADDPDAAAVLGWSPDAVAAVNWVLASTLAGLAGILAAPITALNPTTYSLLVVPALAAAVAGGLSSFGGTAAAALALGMAQSVLVKFQTAGGLLARPGLRSGLPLLVIVIAMVVRGSSLAGREDPPNLRLPAAPRPRRPLLAATTGTALAVAALFTLGSDLRLALVQSLIGAVVCLSLVILTGYLGQISLVQMGLAGVGGFFLSQLADGAGVPFPLAPLAAALGVGLLGLLLGLPALRVRGINLAIVTLAAALAVEELVFKDPFFTGGVAGTTVPDPTLFGLDLGVGGERATTYPRPVFGLFVLAVLVSLGLAVAALRRGAAGRRFLAVRANERAAAVSGVDVARTKLAGFAASAFVAALAGALLGYAQGRLSFGSFGVFASLSYLAVAYIGGIARISGAIVGGLLASGGLVLVALDQAARLGRYELLVTGLALVAMAVRFPDGLVSVADRFLHRGPP